MKHVLDRAVEPVISRVPRWITPNAISAIRAFAVIPIAILYEPYPLVAGFGVFLPAMVLDIFDGPLARYRREESEAGAFLDATADKIIIHGTIWFAFYPRISLALAVMVSLLDLLLTVVRVVKRRYGRPLGANHFGKVKTVVQSIGVGFLIARLPYLESAGEPLLAGAAGLALLSLSRHVFDLLGEKP